MLRTAILPDTVSSPFQLSPEIPLVLSVEPEDRIPCFYIAAGEADRIAHVPGKEDDNCGAHFKSAHFSVLTDAAVHADGLARDKEKGVIFHFNGSHKGRTHGHQVEAVGLGCKTGRDPFVPDEQIIYGVHPG